MERPMRFVRLPEVLARTSLSAVTVWRLEMAGDFPKRRVVGQKAVAWVESELEAWMRDRPLADPGPGS